MRDYQRSKVYAAEDKAFHLSNPPEFKTMEECRAFAETILSSQYWKSCGGLKRFKLVDGRGRRRACSLGRSGKGTNAYALPRWARSRWVIIHEFSHGLTAYTHDGAPWHGSIFCSHYLSLVRELLGNESAMRLEDSFIEHGVKYRTLNQAA